MERNKLAEFGGWVGIGLILLAYAGINFNQLDVESFVYQILNLVGSVLVIWETWQRRNFQPMVLNIVWAAVAVIAIVKAVS